jgi:hypothetical protein
VAWTLRLRLKVLRHFTTMKKSKERQLMAEINTFSAVFGFSSLRFLGRQLLE